MAARKPPVRRAKKRIGLFLHDDRPCRDMTALDYIVDVQPYQIATAQLVVDGEFEQRQFPRSMVQLQSNPNRPDLLQLQRWLLTDQLAFVPRCSAHCFRRSGIHKRLLC